MSLLPIESFGLNNEAESDDSPPVLEDVTTRITRVQAEFMQLQTRLAAIQELDSNKAELILTEMTELYLNNPEVPLPAAFWSDGESGSRPVQWHHTGKYYRLQRITNLDK